jgi:hypothetical protein
MSSIYQPEPNHGGAEIAFIDSVPYPSSAQVARISYDLKKSGVEVSLHVAVSIGKL